jgi:hypothetical protein
MKKILGFILGAGKGAIGTFIRTGVAVLAGYFVTKGFIDEATAASLTDQIVGVVLTVLAGIGSWLNNEAK